MVEKPQFTYWVNPKREGADHVQAITVLRPNGKTLGMTQKWKKVTADEMVADLIEIHTGLKAHENTRVALPNPYIMPQHTAAHLERVLKYLDHEEADFNRMCEEDGLDSQSEHIWLAVQELKIWMNGEDDEPQV